MGAGGIINQRAAVLLLTITDASWYDSLSNANKAVVDTIDAKDPMSRTQDDVNSLLQALSETNC